MKPTVHREYRPGYSYEEVSNTPRGTDKGRRSKKNAFDRESYQSTGSKNERSLTRKTV